jgi:hypothetical protein
MRNGRRYVPPAPGMIASLVSGRATSAEEPKTRMCVESASSNPPPSASEEMAEIVGMGRASMALNVPLSWRRNALVSSSLKPLRSLRSAPAQKLSSMALAMISARVGPCGPSEWIEDMCEERSVRRSREMALRDLGLFRERMRMEPEWGAGMVRRRIRGERVEEPEEEEEEEEAVVVVVVLCLRWERRVVGRLRFRDGVVGRSD